MPDPKEIEQLNQVAESFSTAMVASRGEGGSMHSRPMIIAEHHGNGSLSFLTDADSGKVGEIEADSNVLITMQDDPKFLSLTGRASVSSDKKEIERVWSPAFKIWFENGPEGPGIRLIKFVPHIGEFWDRDLKHTFGFAFEAGKALLTGGKVDASNIGANATVRL